MAKASDNVFPSILLSEGAAPTSPSAGQHRLFVDTADDKLKRKDSAGTVSVVESSGGVFVGARVYNSGNLSLTAGTNTTLTFDSERYDTDSIHSTSSNTGRLTAPSTGYYFISGTAMFSNNISNARGLAIQLNAGATDIGMVRVPTTTGADVTVLQVSTTYLLTAGDYVTLAAYHSSGTAVSITASGTVSPEFMMHRLG